MPALLLFTINGEVTCSVCLGYAGRLYTPGQEPQLPIHDRCDCSYTPVWIDEGTTPDQPAHEHPEINARLATIEERLDRIETALVAIEAGIRDVIGHQVRGAADQVAYFDSANTVVGDASLRFLAKTLLTLAAAANPTIQAQHTAEGTTTCAVIRACAPAARGAGANAFVGVMSTSWAASEYAGWGEFGTGADLAGLLLSANTGLTRIASKGYACIDANNTGGVPQLGFFGATPTTRPTCTDLPSLLAGLAALGLIT